MRKIATVITAVTLLALGSAMAQAQGLQAHALAKAAQNFTPVQNAACQGPGRWCGPGYVRQCGPYRCWCRPCF